MMSPVRKAIETYLAPARLSPDKFLLGSKGSLDFATGLKNARTRSRTGFWICVIMLLILFAVVLFVSYRSFDRLVEFGATSVTGVFGVTAGTCVTIMVRYSRESSRADYLLVLLIELQSNHPEEFIKIVHGLAERWYGIKITSQG